MSQLMGLLMGIGLSAACGFRVFVPLLVMSVAAQSGHLSLTEGFTWIAAPSATAVFAVATGLEIAAFYVPWLDNALDTVAAPAAVVAGTLIVAAAVGEMDPLLRWSLAVIAGGGIAATTQGATTLTRLASTTTTGGLGNPLVSTGEWMGSVSLAGLSVTVPLVAGVAVVVLIGLTLKRAWVWIRRRSNPSSTESS